MTALVCMCGVKKSVGFRTCLHICYVSVYEDISTACELISARYSLLNDFANNFGYFYHDLIQNKSLFKAIKGVLKLQCYCNGNQDIYIIKIITDRI